MKCNHTKKNIEKYDLRFEGSHNWAFIMLDNDYGDISIQSDWGSYSHCWQSRGRDRSLKEFLIGADYSYVEMKFSYEAGGRRYIYENESIKNIRSEIIKKRRTGEIQRNLARGAFDDVAKLDMVSFDRILLELDNDSPLLEIWDLEEFGNYFVTGVKPQLAMFMKKAWPEFIKILQDELEKS